MGHEDHSMDPKDLGCHMKAKRKKSNGTESERLNLLLRPDLKKWAHGYAKKKGKSVSGLIKEFFMELREQEQCADVEQI